MKSENEQLVETVSDYLQQQALELDQDTERKLNKIRAEAVELAGRNEPRSWVAGAGFAAAFSVAVVAGFLMLNTQPQEQNLNVSPLELVLVNDDFEMLEQDLAFYNWVEAELANQG